MKVVGIVLASLVLLVEGQNITCPPGEVFSTCDNPCLPTCEEPDKSNCAFLVCNEGCVCKYPLIRDDRTRRCIPEKFCPVSCDDENAIRTSCAPKCPNTCQRKYEGKCSRQRRPGCECKPGYTKDEISVRCVPTEECPRCSRNEEYDECGTKCPKTCRTKDALIKCVAGCNSGCFCKENFFRDDTTGNCVFHEACPRCGANETFADEGVDCATCSNYMVVKCAPKKEPKCYCLPGYVREDGTNVCKLTQDCPQEQCKGRNEEYSPCDPGPCEPTCQHTEPHVCPEICKLHGCKCKEGYLRDNVTRECRPVKECP